VPEEPSLRALSRWLASAAAPRSLVSLAPEPEQPHAAAARAARKMVRAVIDVSLRLALP